ncbi:condensation domain-containing protein [Streptomyces sp. BK205]|uniref:condensation domain-containing protein n=1 Tax=Streptomyces sp. BK205 TaxID=2512164 RepID=UPI00105111B1|nr:condensation domain-containing protein [Streptomyces sp. BK205]TCR16023.1 condensation domain-containing protein [Streptomyces sp. BK205]
MTGLSTVKQALLDEWRRGNWSRGTNTIAARPSRRTARASIQQKELWNLHQRSKATSSSNISFAATVAADVDEAALTRAVQLLMQRHEILRTSFSVDADDVVWQHVHDKPPAGLTTVDLSQLPPREAFDRARALANEAAAEPFELSTGPLVRTLLFRLGRDGSLIAIVVHHAVADGWSLAVAMNEVTHLYEALARGEEPDLQALPVQYQDYSEWQWSWMDSAEAAEHARYWEQKVASHVAAPLPTDFPRGEKKDLRGGLANVALTGELSAAVRRVAAAEQVSVFVVLFSAFAVLLRERTGEPQVSVGVPVAGRNRKETHPLIGCFASMVPMLARVNDDGAFRDLLRVVHAEAADSVTHEEYSLDMYLNWVEPDRNFATMPMYSAMFGLQPPMRSFEFAGAPLEPVYLDRGETRTAFAVHLWNAEPAIHGTVGYSIALFRPDTVAAIVRRYVEILERATAAPARPVGDLLALAEGER